MNDILIGRRVLIADDHLLFAEGLAALLRDQGCESDIVTTLAAIEPVIAAAPPDLLILDLSFGSDSAMPLLKALRASRPSLPVLVITALEEKVMVERVHETGAAYLAKSKAGADVATIAASLLDGSYRVPIPRMHRTGTATSRNIGGVHLSRARIEVLKFVRKGLTNTEIAARIGRTVKTVEAHMSDLYSRLGVTTRGQMIRWANEHARELGVPRDGS